MVRYPLFRTIAVFASIVGMVCPAFSQCYQYELLVKGGLKKGQSLAIRPFAVATPALYDDESLKEMQKYFGDNIEKKITELARFSSITHISEFDPARADLVLEGTFTSINEGKKGARIIGTFSGNSNYGAATVAVAGVVKRTSSDEVILKLACGSSRHGILGTSGGESLIHSGLRDVSSQIAETISKTDKKPKSQTRQKKEKKPPKPVTRW
jgi:hypothetical protein